MLVNNNNKKKIATYYIMFYYKFYFLYEQVVNKSILEREAEKKYILHFTTFQMLSSIYFYYKKLHLFTIIQIYTPKLLL